MGVVLIRVTVAAVVVVLLAVVGGMSSVEEAHRDRGGSMLDWESAYFYSLDFIRAGALIARLGSLLRYSMGATHEAIVARRANSRTSPLDTGVTPGGTSCGDTVRAGGFVLSGR